MTMIQDNLSTIIKILLITLLYTIYLYTTLASRRKKNIENALSIKISNEKKISNLILGICCLIGMFLIILFSMDFDIHTKLKLLRIEESLPGLYPLVAFLIYQFISSIQTTYLCTEGILHKNSFIKWNQIYKVYRKNNTHIVLHYNIGNFKTSLSLMHISDQEELIDHYINTRINLL